MKASHPSRVRELKHRTTYYRTQLIVSHPSRVRELKHPVQGKENLWAVVAPLPGA